MWAANAGTVSASSDTADHKVHIIPANLVSNAHRFIEADQNYQIFKKIFNNEEYFTMHKPLINQAVFSDEGAANYNRFCVQYGARGLSLFVYGKNGFVSHHSNIKEKLPQKFPARQTLEASQSIARLHQLPKNTLFLQQNPDAIDAGVFHNDVISVANQNVFLFHELAFVDNNYHVDSDAISQQIQVSYDKTIAATNDLYSQDSYENKLYLLKVNNSEISLKEAVSCFLFNSQIVTTLSSNSKDDGKNSNMALIAPIECQTSPSARKVIQRILSEDNPIKSVHYVDCRQSMQNGGGPACLRLRVVLSEAEKNACHQNMFLTNELYEKLLSWINHYYRESIHPKDLLDPALIQESHKALDALTHILHLGSIYTFQK
jgi:succinylarginine dihydrolase